MTEPFPVSARLVAYLRDSGGAKQELSTRQQEQVVRAWCSERGHQLVRLFVDDARPGGSTVGREAFEQLIAYFESKPDNVAGVLFWDYSRWARNVTDGQYFLSLLRVRGYNAYSIQEQIPPGPVGQIVEASYLAMAEQQRITISTNVIRGQRYIVEHHNAYPAPVPPVGYKKERVTIGLRRDGRPHEISRLVPDPDRAPDVTAAFRLAAAGYTYEEINARYHFYAQDYNLALLFRRRVYIGEFERGGRVYPDYCEPLIDRETFDKVQERLAKNSIRDITPRGAKSNYLLSGLVYCPTCGERMPGMYSGSKREPYFRCLTCSNRLLMMRMLEPLVLDAVARLLDRPEVLEDLRAELMRRRKSGDTGRERELSRARHELEAARQAVENLVAHLAAMPPGGKSGALIGELEHQEQAARDAAARVAEIEAAAPPPVVAVGELTDLRRMLAAAIKDGNHRKKQLLLRQIIERIEAIREGKPRTKGGKISGKLWFDLAGLKGVIKF